MKLLLAYGAKIPSYIPKKLQREFLNLPIYFFPQLILQENLDEEIRDEVKKRLDEEKKKFVKYQMYLNVHFYPDISYEICTFLFYLIK